MAADHAFAVRLGTLVEVAATLRILGSADSARTGGLLAGGENQDRIRQRLTDPDTFFFVAESECGDLVGVAAGMSGREDGGAGPAIPGLCHISMVAVHPEHWGRGIGKRLLRALISEARGCGFHRGQLFTHANNNRAQRLYTGLGFTPTGQTVVSGEGEHLVHYLLAPLA